MNSAWNYREYVCSFPSPAKHPPDAPAPPLPVVPGLFPAVPSCSSCFQLRPRQVALGLRASGSLGSAGRGGKRRFWGLNRRQQRLPGVSPGASGAVPGEGTALPGTALGPCALPAGQERHGWGHAAPQGRRISSTFIIPRGKCLQGEGNICMHSVTPTSVNGNYVRKSPNSSVQR